MMTAKITDRQIRDHVLATGAERVRVTRNGEVHAYGRMPNSIVTGWYLVGFRDNLAEDIARESRFREEAAEWSGHFQRVPGER